jgi:cobalt transporter subunit CbtA
MNLFRRIFFAAVLAGLAAGIVMSGLQQWKVAPIILAAEVFEGAEAPAVHTHEHADAAAPAATAHVHEHDENAWAPQDGAERIFYTVLADILACLGFALVLAAVSTIIGIPVTAQNGVIWGIAGFITFHLAPAFGLPPELPGMPAADLGARQIWWWATALCTGAGILAIARYRNWTVIGIAAVLFLLPHIVGAPAEPDEVSAVPPQLSTEFAAHALAVAAVFWLTVAPLYGYLVSRFAAAETHNSQAVPA